MGRKVQNKYDITAVWLHEAETTHFKRKEGMLNDVGFYSSSEFADDYKASRKIA